MSHSPFKETPNGPFKLPPLPWEKNALEPHISKETIDYHYGKHHQAYVTNLNNLTKDTEWQQKSLEDIVKTAKGSIYNNAAQVWNHWFYWNCLNPKGDGEPSTGPLKTQIDKDFGSFAKFKEQFSTAASPEKTFGSGYVWLVKNGNKLEIISASNADTPMVEGKVAILGLDVWEHAYYIDYRNERPKYVEHFWKLVNWDFAEQQFINGKA